MIGSHVAWVFVALLLGVGVGWLTYKRGRARLLDASIWIIIGLVVAAPILLPDLAAAATPLGTLVALFYFVGCPLGWTWRHGARVEYRCAEIDAKGYVFRGAATPSRWQVLGRHEPEAIKLATTSQTSSAPPLTAGTLAMANAAPSGGKSTGSGPAAGTSSLKAGVITAPAALIVSAASDQAHSTSSSPLSDSGGAQKSPGSAAVPAVDTTFHTAPAALPTPNAAPPGGPTDAAAESVTEKPASRTRTVPPPGAAPVQESTATAVPAASAQASLDFAASTSPDTGDSKVDPQTVPAPPTASEPPASAPVPDQHKHAGVRPPGFVTAREDQPDDLQLIRGIGPQNEGRLHGLGIWHFDQIGAWTAEEVRWVGSYLAFPGRIDREKWVEQAREIVAGAIVPKAAARRPARPR